MQAKLLNTGGFLIMWFFCNADFSQFSCHQNQDKFLSTIVFSSLLSVEFLRMSFDLIYLIWSFIDKNAQKVDFGKANITLLVGRW